MKNYNFSSGLVHGALKSYVKNYSRKLQSKKPAEKQPVIEAKAAGALSN